MRASQPIAFALCVILSACSSGGDNKGITPSENPTIALSVDRPGETTTPGATFTFTGTLTRGGGYTGAVSFTVDGVPPGVTATAGTPQGSGATSTVTFTVQVGTGVAAGTYPMIARAHGSGVTPATASFTLSVQATPDYALSVSPTAATINAGASRADIAIGINRTNFTGPVTLSLTGTVPAGVTATFDPAAPATNALTMTLSVASTTAPGSYQLTIQGNGTAGTRTTSFALTVAPAPDFTVAVTPATVSLIQGTSRNDIAVSLTRTNFTGAVTFALAGNIPAGVSATFAPTSTTADAVVMTIVTGTATPVGTYAMRVEGSGAPGVRSTPFTLTVSAPGSFTLGATPAGAINLAAGTNDASKTITITRTNYTASIALVAEGLPAGVTASFAPNPAATNSALLTLTAAASAAVGGPHTITIRGTGPLASQAVVAQDVSATTTITLTIVAAPVISVSETFRGTFVPDQNWIAGGFGPAVVPGWPGKACLTAHSVTTQTPIPGCGMTVLDAAGSGVLRLTERTAAGGLGRTGWVIYNAPVSFTAGLDVTFHQAHYGPSALAADGITFFLTEGNATITQIGAPGSANGYAPVNVLSPGLPQALLGIVFDVYGGFSTSVCAADPSISTGLRPNSVAVRGPGNHVTGYCLLSVADLAPKGITLHATSSVRNDWLTRIMIDPPTAPAPKVTVFINGVQVIQLDVPAQLRAAQTVKFGFAGTTGGFVDNKEIWGLTLNGVSGTRR